MNKQKSIIISKNHSNRGHHNWLVYNIGDRFLNDLSQHFKGDLYDLGCGEAPFKEFFLKYAKNYIGVDWASSIHNTNTDITADLNKELPIASSVADTVVSISVLEHLYNPQKMLNEAWRILKADGVMVLQVPWQWWVHEAPHDYFRYTPYALKRMLMVAGFDQISIMPASGFFTTWFLKFNYFTLTFINRQRRMLRGILKAVLIPIWYINQMIAPWLDKMDKKWENEAQGYFIVAKK